MSDVFAAPPDGARGSGAQRSSDDAPEAPVKADAPDTPAPSGTPPDAAASPGTATSQGTAPAQESEPFHQGSTGSAKIGPAALPGAGSGSAGGRWPSRAGRLTALRAPEEPRRDWAAAVPAPGVPSPAAAPAVGTAQGPAAPAAPGGTAPGGAAPVPPWLAAKTGAPVAGLSEPSRVPPPVPPARPKQRHFWLLTVFVLMVVAPVAASAWYLYVRAADQYASTLAFSVRKEEAPSASDLLGGIPGFSGASSSDTDVLAEFIQSQDMVARIDASLDLRRIYTKPEGDPIFTLDEEASIEDLVTYWNRAVTLFYDASQGLIEVRVLAFEPQDAQDIAVAIYDESSTMINALTAIARDDATRFARADLEAAVDRLKTARTALTGFRSRTQIVDPNADIQGQMGLLNTLQVQLAESLIELDLLRETTREGDPRIRQTEQRIVVIEKRIDAERAKFGIGGGGASEELFADLVGEYESLIVDREFAEQAYLTALTNFDAAQAEAQRQSRYLAAHIQPTLAETAEYPRREMILLALTFFMIAAWGTLMLIYYSIKDRR